MREDKYMKILKRVMALLIVCMTVTVAVPTVFINTTLTVEAHSGRTDAQGGHHDYKNKSGLGSYHYHCGGHPAHLHKDGICPYAGDTSSEAASSTNTSNADTQNANAITTTQNNSNTNQSVSTTNNTSASTVKISDTSYDNVAFNASYYANNNADVYKTCGDDAKALYDHFIKYGIKEGRQSSAQFSILVYKENNQDLADAFGDDLIKYYNHFIEYGVNEDRVSK